MREGSPKGQYKPMTLKHVSNLPLKLHVSHAQQSLQLNKSMFQYIYSLLLSLPLCWGTKISCANKIKIKIALSNTILLFNINNRRVSVSIQRWFGEFLITH